MGRIQLTITVSSGIGEGPTAVAAFDAALHRAGIANYNLISLSSVIPPNSAIVRGPYVPKGDQFGDRLYVVLARAFANAPGTSAWAGLGWVQEKQSGRGLFVELHGETEAIVVDSIGDSLEAMRRTREIDFGAVDTEVVGATCKSQPVCVLAAAVYKAEGWL